MNYRSTAQLTIEELTQYFLCMVVIKVSTVMKRLKEDTPHLFMKNNKLKELYKIIHKHQK